MAPRWLEMAPKSPRRLQDRPKIAPRWPKIVLRWPKMAPRCAKIGLGWPKMDFLGPQKLSWKDLVSQHPEKTNGLTFALPLICLRRKHVLPTHDEQSVFGDPTSNKKRPFPFPVPGPRCLSSLVLSLPNGGGPLSYSFLRSLIAC